MRIAKVVLCVTALSVPGSSRADTTYGLPSGDVAYVYSESAHFRAEPSEASELICSPPVGTPVHGILSTETRAEQNGILSPWIRGICEVEGRSRSGFILMADLALTQLELGGDTLFLFGLDSLGTAGFRHFGHAKTIFEGIVLQRIPVDIPSGFLDEGEYCYSVSSRLIDHTGFPGMSALLILSFEYLACGYVNREVLFTWSDRSLVMGPSADRVFEAGLFRTTEEFLFPQDDGTAAGFLGVSIVSEMYDDEANGYVVTTSDTKMYEWVDGAFRKP